MEMESVVGELSAKYGARGVVFVTMMIDDRQSPVGESTGFVERHGRARRRAGAAEAPRDKAEPEDQEPERPRRRSPQS
jgi:hypothetical protein